MTKKEKGRIRKVLIDVKLLEIILNNSVSDEFLIYFYPFILPSFRIFEHYITDYPNILFTLYYTDLQVSKINKHLILTIIENKTKLNHFLQIVSLN